jgi:hypothetical protein
MEFKKDEFSIAFDLNTNRNKTRVTNDDTQPLGY